MILGFDKAVSQISEEMMDCSVKQLGSHLEENEVRSIPHIIQQDKFQMDQIFNF